jgi:hypothetical protein
MDLTTRFHFSARDISVKHPNSNFSLLFRDDPSSAHSHTLRAFRSLRQRRSINGFEFELRAVSFKVSHDTRFECLTLTTHNSTWSVNFNSFHRCLQHLNKTDLAALVISISQRHPWMDYRGCVFF